MVSLDIPTTLKKWPIVGGDVILQTDEDNRLSAIVSKYGKSFTLLQDRISIIPCPLKDHELIKRYLDDTYIVLNKCQKSYVLTIHHRIKGGMFRPKPMGSIIESVGGRGAVYKSGAFLSYSRLHVAATQGWHDDVEKFISEGDDINMVNAAGNTPLDDAIRERNTKVEQILRDNGAKRSNEL